MEAKEHVSWVAAALFFRLILQQAERRSSAPLQKKMENTPIAILLTMRVHSLGIPLLVVINPVLTDAASATK
jgi:hypothetical protein